MRIVAFAVRGGKMAGMAVPVLVVVLPTARVVQLHCSAPAELPL